MEEMGESLATCEPTVDLVDDLPELRKGHVSVRYNA
jgi:hypothetical protein